LRKPKTPYFNTSNEIWSGVKDMGLFNKPQLYARVNQELRKGLHSDRFTFPKTKAQVFINESKETQKALGQRYDIFLSHSSKDEVEVAGLTLILQDLGYTVYVDWIEDPELNRNRVTKQNAKLLRARMNQCDSLLYAFSDNAATSTWMPWELGYFDGMKGHVAVLPITPTATSDFSGNEYVGLYPYVDISTIQNSKENAIWINESADTYISFDKWLQGKTPYKRN
jgi:hypothetical protein